MEALFGVVLIAVVLAAVVFVVLMLFA